MINKSHMRIIGWILMVVVIATTWIPPEMREVKRVIFWIIMGIALVLYILFLYYNPAERKKSLWWALFMVLLYLVIMKLSQPMMEAPFKYKPPTHNNADAQK